MGTPFNTYRPPSTISAANGKEDVRFLPFSRRWEAAVLFLVVRAPMREALPPVHEVRCRSRALVEERLHLDERLGEHALLLLGKT